MKKLPAKIILALLFTAISKASTAFTTPPCFRYWGSAEYLYWWSSSVSIPLALATQNTPGSLAVIGDPGTQIIFGQGSSHNNFNFAYTSGARASFGGWIDDAYRYGLEASSFALTSKTDILTAASSPTNALDIPFYSVSNGAENVLIGGARPVTITDEDTFQPSSIEINALYRLPPSCLPCFRFPIILSAGFRYMNIDEKLKLNNAILQSSNPESILYVQDKFTSRNHYYGFQFGARSNAEYKNFTFEGMAEIAFGVNYQRLNIAGETTLNNAGLLQSAGLFAQFTNIGSHANNEFSIVPALQLKASYNFHQFVRPFIAYDAIYMSNVLRSAKQVDRNINQTQNPLLGGSGVLVGPAQPSVKFHQSNLWLQGFSLGVDFG